MQRLFLPTSVPKAVARIAASTSRIVMMKTGCALLYLPESVHDAPKRQHGTETAPGIPAEDSYY